VSLVFPPDTSSSKKVLLHPVFSRDFLPLSDSRNILQKVCQRSAFADLGRDMTNVDSDSRL
jgi:hypothetical protein